MNMRKKTWLIAIALVMWVIGCSGNAQIQNQKPTDPNQETAEPAPVSDDPVTLTILNWNHMTEDEFQRYFVAPVAEKLPHITLELVTKHEGDAQEAIASHVMSGEFPDLIFVSNKDINQFLLAKTVHSLDSLVESRQMDLSRFEPMAIQSLQKKEGLAAIPWSQNVAALFYSLDIFDQFGVDYPNDVMTWEETIELSRSLTRNEDGVQYLGINLSSLSQFAQSLSVSYVSPEGDILVDTPEWQRILSFYRTVYDYLGYAEAAGSLFGTKTVAMEPA